MPKYEVQIEETHESALNSLARERGLPIPQLIRELVLAALAASANPGLTEEFRRLVEESITDNEPVLRRFSP